MVAFYNQFSLKNAAKNKFSHHLASCLPGLLSSYGAVPGPPPLHHTTSLNTEEQNTVVSAIIPKSLLTNGKAACLWGQVLNGTVDLTSQLDNPSSLYKHALFLNEGLDVLVSSCLRRVFFPPSNQQRVSEFMKGFFAPQRKPGTTVIQHRQVLTFNTVCAVTFTWMLGFDVSFTDPAGDAVWALCRLVGSRGAAVRDAVGTRALRGRKRRWPLWVHSQGGGCLCYLAQHWSSQHTQSCKYFHLIFTVSNSSKKKQTKSNVCWMLDENQLLLLSLSVLQTVSPSQIASVWLLVDETAFFLTWTTDRGIEFLKGFQTSIAEKGHYVVWSLTKNQSHASLHYMDLQCNILRYQKVEDLWSGFRWSGLVGCPPLSCIFWLQSEWPLGGTLPASCLAQVSYITILSLGPLLSHSTQAINMTTSCPSIPSLFAPRVPHLIPVPMPTLKEALDQSPLVMSVTHYINMHVCVSGFKDWCPIFTQGWAMSRISLVL